jgi:predicted enzyme related to lactoylglutathione lyase
MVHVEIPAGDTGKAREFWGGLFGWQFQAFAVCNDNAGNEFGLWQNDPNAPGG